VCVCVCVCVNKCIVLVEEKDRFSVNVQVFKKLCQNMCKMSV